MRVEHLLASHFRGFEKLEIDFSATNLTVFIGTNGQGKSSVLDLIAAHLNQFVLGINRELSRRNNGDSILTNKDIHNFAEVLESEISFSFDTDLLENEETLFHKSVFPILTNVLSLSRIENSKSTKKANVPFYDFCKNLSEIIRKDTYFALPTLVYYQANRTVYGDVFIRDKSFRHTSSPQLNAYENAFAKSQNDFDDFFAWFRMEEDKENEAIRREKDFDFRNSQLEVVRLAITCFFSFLSGGKYSNLRIVRHDDVSNQGLRSKFLRTTSSTLIIDKNNESLSLNQLSDGEKSVIILICDIARRLAIANPIEKNGDFSSILKNGNGVVLIDEIDLHLHPIWQKEILQALVKTFPSLQFIVATHSPYVVTHLDLDDTQVQVLSITKNGVTPVASKGKDLSTASFEIFGVERRPKQYQSLIDDLFQEFEAEEPNLSVLDKKFLDLKKRLGETDPEVESAKIILEGLKL